MMSKKIFWTSALVLSISSLVHPAAINTAVSKLPPTNSSLPESPTKSTDSETDASYHKPKVSPTANWLIGEVKPTTWMIRGWPPVASSASSAASAISGSSTSPEFPVQANLPIYPPYPSVATADQPVGIEPSAEAVQAQIECPEKSGLQAYAHPEECDQFYLCTNGTLTLERCQNGLLFKGGPGAVHNHCHYHWDVDCNKRHKDMVALSTESCEYQFGMYPEGEQESGCSGKYVVCEFGRAHVSECAAGLAYDPRTHRCNWPDEMMDLKCEPKNLLGFECPEGPPEDPVSARFWPYPRFALKGDCQRLITCVNGQPRLVTCDPDMVVDDSTLTCEEPELVPNCAHFAKQQEEK